jgi:hypothetical protein
MFIAVDRSDCVEMSKVADSGDTSSAGLIVLCTECYGALRSARSVANYVSLMLAGKIRCEVLLISFEVMISQIHLRLALMFNES